MARNIRFTKEKGPPITGKCDFCGERTYLPFQCKRCMGIFCDKHHFPENHSCVPIDKMMKELKQFYESEYPMDEGAKIQSKIQEINRIIVRLQAMYENGEIERSDYLDKRTSFEHDRVELETKLKLFDGNNENAIPVIENRNFGVEDSTEIRNRCQFCYNPIKGIPFKCQRCGLSFCEDHRLPEYHWCSVQKYTRKYNQRDNYVEWILIIIILCIVIIGLPYFISQTNGIKSQNSSSVINYNNSINIIYDNINKLKDSASAIAVETKIEQPKINISNLEYRIHELINEKRRQNGLSSLRYDFKLANIARDHSKDMAERNFFDHVNPQGKDPTARGLESGYRCYKNYDSYYTDGLAENLFQNNLYDSVTYYNGIPSYDWNNLEEIAQSTVNGWMSSPGHKQNILTSSYDKEGIGAAISSDEKVLITQDFC